ncbi:hypothetical protein OXYTRIMIC_002 [Oxytricha trifallax]|uniref:Uncharacterized protein n=1 Tax=Oxytricha trifallax TaxID=1172189 RepID=A0A073IBS2_9SPIT|nr:hypothetical protein OXYTRIMIC_002 [Oxytricha trifallax]
MKKVDHDNENVKEGASKIKINFNFKIKLTTRKVESLERLQLYKKHLELQDLIDSEEFKQAQDFIKQNSDFLQKSIYRIQIQQKIDVLEAECKIQNILLEEAKLSADIKVRINQYKIVINYNTRLLDAKMLQIANREESSAGYLA